MGRASARVVRLIGLTASIACYAPPEREEPPQLPAIELEPVAFPDEPEVQLPELEPGREYEVELLGELTLAPNAYGGRFVTPGGQELVLYSANAALLPFHGRRVRARGHVWTCDGERVFAPHDLSLVPEQTAYPGSELPPPPRVDSAGQLANLRSALHRGRRRHPDRARPAAARRRHQHRPELPRPAARVRSAPTGEPDPRARCW